MHVNMANFMILRCYLDIALFYSLDDIEKYISCQCHLMFFPCFCWTYIADKV